MPNDLHPIGPASHHRLPACLALLAACACWGLSLPLERALLIDQAHDQPAVASWCLSAWSLCLRFLIAAGILLVVARTARARPTAGEVRQGLGLGVLTAIGLLLQMDALAYAQASTVAFLSQCYAVWIPLVLALRHRRIPDWQTTIAVVAVLAGAGFLVGFDPAHVGIGRGEAESLIGSLVFTIQILLVEHRGSSDNRTAPVALASFIAAAVVMLPVAVAGAPTPRMLITLYADPVRLGILLILAGVATCLGLLLMYRWQRFVGASTAAVIYCTEPVYTAAIATVLPSLLSTLLGISYQNELLTNSLLAGGSLILAANLVVQWRPTARVVG